MLDVAFVILTVAALIGATLAVLYLRGSKAARPHTPLPLGHGALGIVGFGLLLAVLRHGVKSTGSGTGDFGLIAAGFFGVALLAGLLILLTGRRRRPGGLLVATHASLAIAGLVVLLTLVALQ